MLNLLRAEQATVFMADPCGMEDHTGLPAHRKGFSNDIGTEGSVRRSCEIISEGEPSLKQRQSREGFRSRRSQFVQRRSCHQGCEPVVEENVRWSSDPGERDSRKTEYVKPSSYFKSSTRKDDAGAKAIAEPQSNRPTFSRRKPKTHYSCSPTGRCSTTSHLGYTASISYVSHDKISHQCIPHSQATFPPKVFNDIPMILNCKPNEKRNSSTHAMCVQIHARARTNTHSLIQTNKQNILCTNKT